MKRELSLENCVGWGREIHIETHLCTYAGSGRGFGKKTNNQIRHTLPTLGEFVDDNGFAISIFISGFQLSRIRKGDRISYKLEDNSRFVLKMTEVDYKRDPDDMFFGRAILVDVAGKDIPRRTIANLFKKEYRRRIKSR